MIPRPLRSPLFPYTTLFRSNEFRHHQLAHVMPPVSVVLSTLDRRRTRDSSRLGPRSRRSVARDPQDRQLDVEERSEEHTSELQSPDHLVCRLLLEKKKSTIQ